MRSASFYIVFYAEYNADFKNLRQNFVKFKIKVVKKDADILYHPCNYDMRHVRKEENAKIRFKIFLTQGYV